MVNANMLVRCHRKWKKRHHWQREFGGYRYRYHTYWRTYRGRDGHLGFDQQWCATPHWQHDWLLRLSYVVPSHPPSPWAVPCAKALGTFHAAELTVVSLYLFDPTACSSPPQISISFGGPAWPISTKDINFGPIGKGLCLGAIFDLTAGTNVKPQSGQPAWIIGDTFLVRFSPFLTWSLRQS